MALDTELADATMGEAMGRIVQLEGKRFGMTTVLSLAGLNRRHSATWLVRCDCGVQKVYLQPSRRQSCGCLRRLHLLKHGEAIKGIRTVEYRTWASMIQRCTNPRYTHFRYYGGRGITICQRWRESYENFLADMGRKPSEGHSIERINNDGNYEPGNCRWATKEEQLTNRRPYQRRVRDTGEEDHSGVEETEA